MIRYKNTIFNIVIYSLQYNLLHTYTHPYLAYYTTYIAIYTPYTLHTLTIDCTAPQIHFRQTKYFDSPPLHRKLRKSTPCYSTLSLYHLISSKSCTVCLFAVLPFRLFYMT